MRVSLLSQHHTRLYLTAGAVDLACGCRLRAGLRPLHNAPKTIRSHAACARRHLCQAVQQSVEEQTLRSRDGVGSSVEDEQSGSNDATISGGGNGSGSNPELQKRYEELQKSMLAPLLRFRGFEERLLADPSFMVKVGIEVGIGIGTKSTAEAAKRGDMLFKELDFVAANVIMALVADFCLVYLPAPRATWRSGQEPSALSAWQNSSLYKFVQACPGNCFQTVQPGVQPYTLQQRSGALLISFVKLLAVGTTASLVGVGLVNTLTFIRQSADPTWTPLNPPQNILATSLFYGAYMGVFSNIRYQIVAGVIEERGIEKFFKGRPQVCAVLSFLVRTSNTFIGSLLWVDFIRLMGMQSAAPH